MVRASHRKMAGSIPEWISRGKGARTTPMAPPPIRTPGCTRRLKATRPTWLSWATPSWRIGIGWWWMWNDSVHRHGRAGCRSDHGQAHRQEAWLTRLYGLTSSLLLLNEIPPQHLPPSYLSFLATYPYDRSSMTFVLAYCIRQGHRRITHYPFMQVRPQDLAGQFKEMERTERQP